MTDWGSIMHPGQGRGWPLDKQQLPLLCPCGMKISFNEECLKRKKRFDQRANPTPRTTSTQH
jgi:hypothetical protein